MHTGTKKSKASKKQKMQGQQQQQRQQQQQGGQAPSKKRARPAPSKEAKFLVDFKTKVGWMMRGAYFPLDLDLLTL